MFTYSKEEELHRHIAENFNDFFEYNYIQSELKVTGGRIDILAEDEKHLYVIELKRDLIKRETINQLDNYLKRVAEMFPDRMIKGIASAPAKSSKLNDIPKNIEIVLLENVKLDDSDTQVCITLPKEIVAKIDKEAKNEMRSRSKQIAKVVIEQYENKK